MDNPYLYNPTLNYFEINRMMKFLVSIIVPVYKVKQYIGNCINSVFAQTYSNIELILVDDCSPDDSIKIAKSIIERSDLSDSFKINFVRHETNRGVSAARNTGIKASKGDYLFFLDADDTIIPECVEMLVDQVYKHPQVDIVQASVIGNDIPWFQVCNKGLPAFSDNRDWIKRTFMHDGIIPVICCNKLIRRDFAISNSLFFIEGVAFSEDVLWTWFMSKYIRTIAFVDKETYYYRQHDGSATHGGQKVIRNAHLELMSQYINSVDPYCKEA